MRTGDAVKDGDVLAQIETDKVTIDVKYTEGQPGVVSKVLVKEEDTVEVGQECFVVDVGASGGKEAGGGGAEQQKAAPAKEEAAPKEEKKEPEQAKAPKQPPAPQKPAEQPKQQPPQQAKQAPPTPPPSEVSWRMSAVIQLHMNGHGGAHAC
jgi:pyruvate/2-oxoglutarate dehydrogenase complex dihydrolipoamide acyltransferase (E2) component